MKLEYLSGRNRGMFALVENPEFIPFKPSFKIPLNGLSYDRASLYGMPHIHCTPHGIEGRCAICGRRATEKHHMAPKGTGAKYLTFTAGETVIRMESALVALCHRCHDKFKPQGTEYEVNWYWKDQRSANLFWSGALFEKGITPHSEDLYEYGFYIFRSNGRVMGGVFG